MPIEARKKPKTTAAAALVACVFANSAFAADLPAAPAERMKPVVAEAAMPAPGSTWLLNVNDLTLKRAMQRWAAVAGWQLVWELQADYPITAYAEVPGDFESAVGTVAQSLEHADVPVKAIFYRGNKVLRIVAKGAQ